MMILVQYEKKQIEEPQNKVTARNTLELLRNTSDTKDKFQEIQTGYLLRNVDVRKTKFIGHNDID